MERKQIEEIGRLLGLDTEQLESLFVACPVAGWAGHEVAAELCQRFGLEADEPLGKQLWAAGVLTQAQGRWLDDEDEKEFCYDVAERTFSIDGGEHIDLLTDGSFTAYSLRTGGGDIVYIGSFWDAETETDHAAELHVTLEASVEDLLPGWREATGEEISAACENFWVGQRVWLKEYKIFEDNAGGVFLFVFGAGSIEYSFEYTDTAPGQLAQDLAELHKTGTTADWDHEFCLPEPEQTLETLRRWVDEGTGGAKLIADQDGVYLDRAGVAGRLALGDEMYTVTEAAEALELSEPRVRTLCQEGRMGRKVGRDWIITADDIESMRDRPGPGRPRKE